MGSVRTHVTRFTPGPWRFKIGDSFSANDYIVEQDTAEEKWVILRWEPGPYRDGCNEQANARLIAAAPELGEMLLSAYVHVTHGGPTREQVEALLKKAGLLP